MENLVGLRGSSEQVLDPVTSMKLQKTNVVAFDEKQQGLAPDAWAARAGGSRRPWDQAPGAAAIKRPGAPAEDLGTESLAQEQLHEHLGDYGVSFNGGGAQYTYTIDGTKETSHEKADETELVARLPSLSVESQFTLGFFSANINLGISSAVSHTWNRDSYTASESTEEMSFTMRDPDVGDKFDVQVRSFVFL